MNTPGCETSPARTLFRRWQWRTLAVTTIGYALYYIIRKNLSIAMPLLGEIGVSKVQLGAFLTAGGLIYGLGRFLNGIVADRHSARKVMASGLFICGGVNILFAFSDYLSLFRAATAPPAPLALVWTMGMVWIVNQYFQGMGVGPCIKTLPKWFAPEELSTRQSIWNLSHSIGAGAVFALCGWYLIPRFHSWRLCFIVPAAIAIAGAAAVLAFFKDSPEDAGLAGFNPGGAAPHRGKDSGGDYAAYISKHVFRNPKVWIIAIADFFVYTVRFAALDWGIVLLMETKGLSLAGATSLLFAFEIVGGNMGMVVAGWATDRFFHSAAHRTSLVALALSALAIAAFYFVPANAPLAAKMIPFVLTGFFIYAPQALLGVATTQQATPRAAGVAGGFVGIFSYASTILSGLGFGYIAQNIGWHGAYATMFLASIAGAAVLAPLWKCK